ncbi:hypothetical protein DL346_20185 [Paenibacillus montanisoli]|uniref:Uncharacterized protein n=1 Tax=Paenibacillus montanisoli TaxID=2081970 RepID=A0A328U078_9BACL|nr:hypothetical protein DL346_20185 [Paenibacillus montanisoli]
MRRPSTVCAPPKTGGTVRNAARRAAWRTRRRLPRRRRTRLRRSRRRCRRSRLEERCLHGQPLPRRSLRPCRWFRLLPRRQCPLLLRQAAACAASTRSAGPRARPD